MANSFDTPRGTYTEDPSGVWHYRVRNGDLHEAAKDAWQYRPATAWFWFNGTFALIFKNDDPDLLKKRWARMRDAYQGDPNSLLRALEEYSQFQ